MSLNEGRMRSAVFMLACMTVRDEKWRLQHSLPMSGGGAWTFTLFNKPSEESLDEFVVESALLPPLEHGGGAPCAQCLRGERHGADSASL